MFRDGSDVQIVADASNPNIAQSSTGYLQAMISGSSGGTAGNIDTHFLYNPQLKSSYNFAPGIMGMLFMLVCALMTAVSVVREKETGTMELLLVSPVRPIQIIISKMVPFFVLSCVDLALMLGIARWLLDGPYECRGIAYYPVLVALHIALPRFGIARVHHLHESDYGHADMRHGDDNACSDAVGADFPG